MASGINTLIKSYLQNIIQFKINIILFLIRDDVEVFIAIQHCRDVRLGLIVKNIDWYIMGFSISQLISYSKRRASTFRYHHITLSEPFRISLIYMYIYGFRLSFQAHVRLANMFCQDCIRTFDVVDDSFVKSSINPSSSYGTCKIYFLAHVHFLILSVSE